MSDMKQRLTQLIGSRTAVIGIVGMGYVGQPLALRYSETGFKVIGFDINQKRVNDLNLGKSEIEHIPDSRVLEAIATGMRCTSDFSEIADVDAIIICVPTPLSKHREPDLGFVTRTCESISPFIRPGQVICLESTTYPGTTEELIVPALAKGGMKVGEDIFCVYSPEREDPGNNKYTTHTIPKVVGGHTKNCLEIGMVLYGTAIETIVPVSSTKAAELTKLLENIHRSVNIGLVNEMKIVAEKMGINIWEVIEAAATKPFGFTPYYPGPGLGGHCIPIDPFYLTWKAREYGVSTRFIELAGEVNGSMPDYVVDKVKSALNDRLKPVRGSKILVLGIAYKANVDDMRESPAVLIMEKLRNLGAEISYSDPHVPVFPPMREHRFDLSSIPLSPEMLSQCDCVILATEHAKFDYAQIAEHAPLIVDSRGKFDLKLEKVVGA